MTNFRPQIHSVAVRRHKNVIFYSLYVAFCLLSFGGFEKAQAKPNPGRCAKYFKETPDAPIELQAQEKDIVYRIEDIIEAVLKTNKRPQIIFDLDGTVYLSQQRILQIMRQYDSLNGSSYFKDANVSQIDPEASYSFIRWRISKFEKNEAVKSQKMDEAIQYLKIQMRRSDTIALDAPFEKTVHLMRSFKRLGAEIIVLTERRDYFKKTTERKLNFDRIPFDRVIYRPESTESVDIIKTSQIEDLNRSNDSIPVAYFEDNQANLVSAMDLRVPGMLGVWVKTRFQNQHFTEFYP